MFDRTINMFYEGDSSLEVRGYKVFLKVVLFALFGMGIKNIINIQKYEIHSTFVYDINKLWSHWFLDLFYINIHLDFGH